eukprot:SAG25_NODE_1433_length_3034_cov_2.112095_3_plen_77_part_00
MAIHYGCRNYFVSVVYVDIKGLAICDPKPVGNDATSESYNVVMHYPFTRIRRCAGIATVVSAVGQSLLTIRVHLRF